MTFYVKMLGLMELLTPYVFRPEYTEAFHDALSCYFDMFKAYFNKKDSMAGMIFLRQI